VKTFYQRIAGLFWIAKLFVFHHEILKMSPKTDFLDLITYFGLYFKICRDVFKIVIQRCTVRLFMINFKTKTVKTARQ